MARDEPRAADAGGADLAHKLASVVDGVFASSAPPRSVIRAATASLPARAAADAAAQRDDATRTRDSTRSNTPSGATRGSVLVRVDAVRMRVGAEERRGRGVLRRVRRAQGITSRR